VCVEVDCLLPHTAYIIELVIVVDLDNMADRAHRAIITTCVDVAMIMWLSVESGVMQSVQSQLISHLFSLHFTLEQR
jgi:hypothetical protein